MSSQEHSDEADSKRRALDPPTGLVDMRLIYDGQVPLSTGQAALVVYLANHTKEYMAQMLKSEKEYRDFMKDVLRGPVSASGGTRGQADSLDEDEGALKAQDLIKKILAEANREIDDG